MHILFSRLSFKIISIKITIKDKIDSMINAFMLVYYTMNYIDINRTTIKVI
jgi:hypothetical protein